MFCNFIKITNIFLYTFNLLTFLFLKISKIVFVPRSSISIKFLEKLSERSLGAKNLFLSRSLLIES